MAASLRKRFGLRVVSLRRAAGYSQEAFADASGFARSYMSRIERGAANPSLDAIETLAAALKVPPITLFSDDLTAVAAGKRVGALKRR